MAPPKYAPDYTRIVETGRAEIASMKSTWWDVGKWCKARKEECLPS